MKRTLVAIAVAAALPLTALAQMGSPSAPPKSPSSTSPGMSKDSSSSPSSSSMSKDSKSSGSATEKNSLLASLDTNKDGFVSKKEAKGSADISKHFKTLDKDHNGKLSASELAAASSPSDSSSHSSSSSSSKSGGTSPGSSGSPKSKY